VKRSSFLSITGILAPLFFAGSPPIAAPVEKPIISVSRPSAVVKSIKASVTVESSLRAYPKAYDDLVAEGRREVEAWLIATENAIRTDPSSFGNGMKLSIDISYNLSVVAGAYVSIWREGSECGGGAPCGGHVETILWHLPKNERVGLQTLFKETKTNGPTMNALAQQARLAAAKEKLRKEEPGADPRLQELRDKVEEDGRIQDGIKPNLEKIGPMSLAPSTVKGKSSGLLFYYWPYAISQYAAGAFIAYVPWQSFEKLLSPKGKLVFGGTLPPDENDK
jgi:hypothetical protein